MPRDIAILDAYVPTIVLLFIAGAALTWLFDRVLALTGLIASCGIRPCFARACSCACAGCSVSPFIVEPPQSTTQTIPRTLDDRIMTIRNSGFSR